MTFFVHPFFFDPSLSNYGTIEMYTVVLIKLKRTGLILMESSVKGSLRPQARILSKIHDKIFDQSFQAL